MRRGDLVSVAVAGDYGERRPADVVRADAFRALSSVTVLRLTSELHDWPMFRVAVEPSEANGLRRRSQVLIDRAIALPRAKIGAVYGHLDDATMSTVSRALAAFLDLDGATA